MEVKVETVPDPIVQQHEVLVKVRSYLCVETHHLRFQVDDLKGMLAKMAGN